MTAITALSLVVVVVFVVVVGGGGGDLLLLLGGLDLGPGARLRPQPIRQGGLVQHRTKEKSTITIGTGLQPIPKELTKIYISARSFVSSFVRLFA